MAKKLDIGALLGDTVSNLDAMRVREIPLDKLLENDNNVYLQTDIDALAESIAVVGLQQPLVVAPQGDGYLLLSGHRRRNALALLGRINAPCVVLDDAVDPAIRTLILHWTNTMARGGAGLTGGVMSAAAKEIEAALTDLKARGVVELPGKLREYVAEVLRVSESALARAKAIDNNLIAALKRDLGSHKINDSVAYELSQCGEDLQRRLRDAYRDNLYHLDAKSVKAHKKADASGFAPLTCPAVSWGKEPCVGTDKRAAAVKRGECPGCCHGCDKAAGCAWVCGKVSQKMSADKSAEERKTATDKADAAFAASEAGKAYAHARAVLEQHGCSGGHAPEGMSTWQLSALWSQSPAQSYMPSLQLLGQASAALGVSLQELLFGAPQDAAKA